MRWTVVIVQPRDLTTRESAGLFCPNHVNNANNFISMHVNNSSASTFPMVRLVQTAGVTSCHESKVAGPKKLKRKRVYSSDRPELKSAQNAVIVEASTRQARLENLRRRRQGAAAFVLEEAEVDSDDSGDEDEDLELEGDEMSDDSFINDATELTQHLSQDHLASVDPDACEETSFRHRALDAQRAIAQQYMTPLLNRRMTRPHDSAFSSSSQKGLGNMHFVRSVLEHHRQGGTAEDIEACYRLMQHGDLSPEETSQSPPF